MHLLASMYEHTEIPFLSEKIFSEVFLETQSDFNISRLNPQHKIGKIITRACAQDRIEHLEVAGFPVLFTESKTRLILYIMNLIAMPLTITDLIYKGDIKVNNIDVGGVLKIDFDCNKVTYIGTPRLWWPTDKHYCHTIGLVKSLVYHIPPIDNVGESELSAYFTDIPLLGWKMKKV